MAAIGSKRKRFVGDGNDAMQVTSLVKSLVSLPLGKSGARVHPSPGSITSSRLAVQTDLRAERCVAYVASGGGVYRHEVSFDGGTNVAEGKEAMLKPNIVHDGRTTHIPHVHHRAEIQSLALYDPLAASDNSIGGGVGDGVRLASVDARGRALVTTLGRDWMSDTDMASFAATASFSSSSSSSSRQYALEPYEPGYGRDARGGEGEGGGCRGGGGGVCSSSTFAQLQHSNIPKFQKIPKSPKPALCPPPPPPTVRGVESSPGRVAMTRGAGSSMPGWAGVCFNNAAPESVAVARHFAKSVDVFDGDRRVRTLNTLLNPFSVAFVPTNAGGKIGGVKGGGDGGGGGGGNPGGQRGEGLLAVAEGNQLSLWDVRQSVGR